MMEDAIRLIATATANMRFMTIPPGNAARDLITNPLLDATFKS